MRVISGTLKGRPLVSMPGTDITRPTSDRVKENIFNIIKPEEIQDAVVFDLFAGSGALGIECISRGAKKVIFVEKEKKVITYIKSNLEKLKIPNSAYQIVSTDVSAFLAKPDLYTAEKAHIIFADPPYKSSWYVDAFAQLESSQCCHENALGVFEMSAKSTLESNMPKSQWALVQAKTYGKTKVEFWRFCCE